MLFYRNFLHSEKKLEKYVQISKSYFALDDPGYAVPWIEQSVHLKEECENETLILEFELIFAKHLDFLKKFLPASLFYYRCANKIQGLAGTVIIYLIICLKNNLRILMMFLKFYHVQLFAQFWGLQDHKDQYYELYFIKMRD